MNKKIVLGILVVLTMMLFAVSVAAEQGMGPGERPGLMSHTNDAELEPEWSPSGEWVDYTVTLYNTGDPDDDPVDEIRIYKNELYGGFEDASACADKTGWEKNFIYTKKACHYIATDPSYFIQPGGDSEFFEFTAQVPGPGNCSLQWKFETRDTNEVWLPVYDSTSVDSKDPVIVKTMEGGSYDEEHCPPDEEGEVCWMTQEASIVVYVYDVSMCDPPSLVDYCDFSVTLDGDPYDEWTVYADENGEVHETIQFEEDSEHVLTIECYDNAGNSVEDVEIFKVDTTPPETDKTYGEPHFPEGINEGAPYPHWITTSTLITLTFEDLEEPCAIGVDKTWYIDTVVDDFFCEGQCQPVCPNPYDDPGNAECIEYYQLWCEIEDHQLGTWENCVQEMVYNECEIHCQGEPWLLYTGPFTKNEESCHVLQYFSVDHLGNVEPMEWQCVYVEDTPPQQIKIVGAPSLPVVGADFDYWVTQNTPITLLCDDKWACQAPHPVYNEELCFKVSFDLDTDGYLTEEYCDEFGGTMEDGWCCIELYEIAPDGLQGAVALGVIPPEPTPGYEFHFMEDSVHDLEFFCRDGLGNAGEPDLEYFKVDTVPPDFEKTMIGDDHLGDCPPTEEGDICYVRDDGQNGVHIEVWDEGDICHVDGVICYYGLWWMTDEQTCIDKGYDWDEIGNKCAVEGGSFPDYLDIYFHEDSTHILYLRCVDALGNEVVDDLETFLVDSLPPVTTKIIGDPLVEDWFPKGCYEEFVEQCEGNPECIARFCGWAEWINTNTPITLNAEDTKVGVDKIWYKNRILTGEAQMACENPALYCIPELLEDCMYCQDGNYPRECIDRVQAECTESYEPYTEDWYLCVERQSNAQCCGGWDWSLYKDEPIYKPEESCHVLYYFGVDKLGNVEPINVNCFFVDNTAPETGKVVGDPKVEKNDKVYITSQTPITLTCMDVSPHPVDHVSLWYRYRVSDDCEDWGDWTDWIDPDGYVVEKTIYFPTDSCHELEYYCIDRLGNEEEHHFEIDVVDSKPPVIEKELVGPYIGDCLPEDEEDECYIDGVTEIHVDAVDQEPHPVDEVLCSWDYEVIDGDKLGHGEQELTPPFIITFPEESTHMLTIRCWDRLGNAVGDVEKFLVDKTPPGIWKRYGQPYYSDIVFPEVGDPFWAEWINSLTPIYAGVTDNGPHKSGIKEVKYRTTVVANDYCKHPVAVATQVGIIDGCAAEGSGDWTIVDPEDYNEWDFNIDEESCHLIEIVATDNVGKFSDHKQCVFVDNSAPEPNKEVGEPKDLWTPGENGDPISYFYPEETAHCWDDTELSIDCWEVTMTTPIDLACVDPDPHPVDHEVVCFNVELDGEDYTEEYCSYYGGVFNKFDDGYCCLDYELNQFLFKEETEHNLKYYCIDALGNKGERIDEEKFKVGGTRFDIPLFKKWNLISVPFVLLNDDPEEVFKDLEHVEVVLAYDSETGEWLAWAPDSELDNTLEHIRPGWGYFVFMMEDEVLTIGGSLFSPGVMPPSKPLMPGWNLVGYYGTSWELYPYMDDYMFECGDAFDFPENLVYGDKVYCALNSLVDTQEGYPRWSSVWSYVNCGEHHAAWIGLNACADYGDLQTMLDRMYAGRGYWVEMDIEDIYSPATTCIWNDDFECVWSGGGLIP